MDTRSPLSPDKQALLDRWKAGQFKSEPIPKRVATETIPLSFSQQRLWFVDQLYQGSPFYNIPIALHLKGTLNVTALQYSLNEILRRHEAWRTAFVSVNGHPTQVIRPSKSIWELPIMQLEPQPGQSWEAQLQDLVSADVQMPIDLAQGWLAQAKLLRLDATESIFLLMVHHIVADGWSIGIFLQELATLYAAFCNRQPSPLSELPIQYADFACWQRDRLQGEQLQTQLQYWRRQLDGDLPVLQLPTDFPRPAKATFKGAKHYFKLSQSLTEGLRQLSQQADVTLFMTLLAAFKTLLYRYTDQEDILVGSAIANRNRAELEGMLGLFVNTLVLRGDLSGNPTFLDLLRRVRDTTLSAYAHQDLPFDKLIEDLQPDRDLSRNPLFQVMFVLQNSPVSAQSVSGLTLRPLELDSGTAQFDVFLSMSETPQGLKGVVEYSTDLFESTTITRLLEHFQQILTGIITNSQHRLSELPLLTVHEQQQLATWNQTASDYPRTVTLHELFEQQVLKSPNAIAIVDQAEQLTYQELNQRSNQLAHYLQTQGVTTETLVAVCLERSVDLMVSVLAILKAGGAYLPLDPSYPRDRLGFILSDSQATVLLTRHDLLTNLPSSSATRIDLDYHASRITENSQANLPHRSTADHLAYVIYTSGSTGTPKGVLGTHRGTVNGLHWLWKTYPFAVGEVCCQKTAISFVDSIWEMFAPLLQGVPTILISDTVVTDPPHFLETLAENQITRLMLVPSLLRVLLDTYKRVPRPIPQLQLWIVSGEVLSKDLVQTFQTLMPTATLLNLYGSSEVSANVTYYDTQQLSPTSNHVPIGRPIDNTQVYVLDRHCQPSAMGVMGDLYVGGDGLAKGYLHRPDLTQERFVDHPFRPGTKLYKTGDRGRYLRNGELEYGGRQDDQVKIRGIRIELGEIQSQIAQHPSVQDCVVMTRNDIQGNPRLTAYIVADTPDIVPSLKQYLQQTLPVYMIPAAIVRLDSLPLTPNGKVDKQSLPMGPTTQSHSTVPFIAPRSFGELALTRIWEQLLTVSSIGVTDNFFDLGGHSLLAARLAAQIHERFGQNLPLSVLFEQPTIAQQAQLLAQPPQSASPLVAIQPSGSKLPFFCIHPAGGAIHPYFALARLLGPDQPFYALEQTPHHPHPDDISVEQAATHYLELIRTVQPQGPYQIGGWCYGGLVAFELAQQLVQQGESVQPLVVIDAILPAITIKAEADDDAKLILRLAESVKTWFGLDFALSYQDLRSRSLDEQFQFLAQKANLSLSEAETQQHLQGYKLFKAHMQAMRAYVPQVYPHKILLLRATEPIVHEFDSSEFFSTDPWLGWGKCSDHPIQAIDIPGNHFSILAEPHVQNLVSILRENLNKDDSLYQ
jgi:amino acid adenylation domain-containing protein